MEIGSRLKTSASCKMYKRCTFRVKNPGFSVAFLRPKTRIRKKWLQWQRIHRPKIGKNQGQILPGKKLKIKAAGQKENLHMAIASWISTFPTRNIACSWPLFRRVGMTITHPLLVAIYLLQPCKNGREKEARKSDEKNPACQMGRIYLLKTENATHCSFCFGWFYGPYKL